jgi:microcystin-dependent protein
MVEPFVAEIRMFGFNFPPRGWAHCNGQLMPITQNTALFALLGTFYGGNGQSTFALPDLQASAPLGMGNKGQGLSTRVIGEMSGSEFVTLLESEIPFHTHAVRATNSPADVSSPTPTTALARSTGKQAYAPSDGNNTPLAATAISVTGGDLPHNNLMPYLVLNFCIALQGVFPQRA